MNRKKVQIFEDDRDIALLLERAFQKEGFQTQCSFEGRDFIRSVEAFNPDLVILDLLLPGIDGYSICRCIKNADLRPDVKVIMLTAKSEESDIIHGYEAGVDDYMTKPFSPKEVLARAKAVLRRQNPKGVGQPNRLLKRDQLSIDDARYEATLEGKPIDLTQSEYRILRTLASQPQRVYTREQLAERIASGEFQSSNSSGSRNIDVHIRSLRKKLSRYSYYIRTMRGVGYSFDTEK